MERDQPTPATNGHHPTAGLPLRTLSALASRAALASRLGWTFSGDRKIHEILGYKSTLTYADFKARYQRQDIARRLVNAYPEATWAQPPTIKEDDMDERHTPFEIAWDALTQRLGVFAVLKRLDILANLGQYAVLLLGLRGQRDLSQPATPVRSHEDLLYLTPYSEEWATIERFEEDASLPTFGQPLVYRVDFGRAGHLRRTARSSGQRLVHASRLIHVAAEDLLDDEIYGLPQLENIYDRLDDLLKIVGGGAEGFWVDARRRLVFALRDDYRLDPEDEQALADEIDEFVHLQRPVVKVAGVDVAPLPGQATSPRDHFDVIIDIIAAAKHIPKRKLMGSERGELASGQDEREWKENVVRREHQYAEPRLLRALIDRCILFQALPAPRQPYHVAWDNLLGLGEEQQAEIAKNVATALNQFAPNMAESIVTREEFRVEYLGLSPEPEGGFPDLEPGEDEPLDDENTVEDDSIEEVADTDDVPAEDDES